MDDELNRKQELFCEEYARTGFSTESYMTVYHPKNKNTAKNSAIRLLKLPKIQKRLQELAAEIGSEKIASAKEMQEKLTAIIRQEATDEVIVTEMVGDGVSEARKVNKKPDAKVVVAAIDKLARIQGVYDTNPNVTINIPVFDQEDKLED